MKRTSMFLVLFVLLIVASTSIAAPPPPDPDPLYEDIGYNYLGAPDTYLEESDVTGLTLYMHMHAYANPNVYPSSEWIYSDYVNGGSPVVSLTMTDWDHYSVSGGSGGDVSMDGQWGNLVANSSPRIYMDGTNNGFWSNSSYVYAWLYRFD